MDFLFDVWTLAPSIPFIDQMIFFKTITSSDIVGETVEEYRAKCTTN